MATELTAFSAFATSFSTLALVPTLARRTITSLTQTETAACVSSFTFVTTLTVRATVAVSCVYEGGGGGSATSS